ncbi:MAG: hypothetical protein OEZ01_00690 [Candidatus Heimdallarchaeota archaeon]|nr:hypothetical protein [Candidatus Heimdallarchaeota archaeon]
MKGPKRYKQLANDVTLLSALGEVVTIQIDLIGSERVENTLKTHFNDSESDGLYIDGMILQRIMENNYIDYLQIFEKIAEITGNYEAIDSITALIRIHVRENPVEVTVQLIGDGKQPQLMQTTDHKKFFDIINIIQAKWQIALMSLHKQ